MCALAENRSPFFDRSRAAVGVQIHRGSCWLFVHHSAVEPTASSAPPQVAVVHGWPHVSPPCLLLKFLSPPKALLFWVHAWLWTPGNDFLEQPGLGESPGAECVHALVLYSPLLFFFSPFFVAEWEACVLSGLCWLMWVCFHWEDKMRTISQPSSSSQGFCCCVCGVACHF